MTQPVAIVGMACRYPDAASPDELWENVLARRRAFRRIPPERLRLEDYFSAERDAPDCVYSSEAAVIEGYQFDRVRFRVAGNTFRAADPAHWLALETAARAVEDADYGDGGDLPRSTTGVFLGNTLTGEFSRAQMMRLRWPYVRRVVEASLAAEGWSAGRRRGFVERLERAYKEPFAPVGEETLAGSLSNTIAGRICNHFDLKGGGYTVDGACASSLLAVINACAALAAGDLDVALAGGVDLSLDPFELVGFAKAGALAAERMCVYDRGSKGFWPGEGCGFVLLMRLEDALAERRSLYAVIRGWGVSSDGSGGITRPEEEGQLLALERAYRRAGFGVGTVAYLEGHGTGTSVGDATELRALKRARRGEAAGGQAATGPAVIGSVKANIGHTKAAAGVAGLIKAAMALRHQILPPTTGCENPHPEISGEATALRVLSQGELWTGGPLRAGVSAMGFGGINTHVVLEGSAPARRPVLSPRERALLYTGRDAELLLFGARDDAELRHEVARLAAYAAKLSSAEVTDVAARLAAGLDEGPREVRAGVVASGPAELARHLELLLSLLDGGRDSLLDTEAGVFLGRGRAEPRVGFLFPGQGSPTPANGGEWRNCFPEVQELYGRSGEFPAGEAIGTAVAQPAITTASVAGLRLLARFGLAASAGVGHSLGELVALHWAGALSESELLHTARVRGRVMGRVNGTAGAMAGIGAGRQVVEELTAGAPVVIAGYNSPSQTVISGAAGAVAEVAGRARRRGLRTVGLAVSHAFHSPLMAPAEPAFAQHLSGVEFGALRHPVVSTVTGALLGPDADLRSLLRQQLTRPVLFTQAVEAASALGLDFWVEVGPGQVLRGLVGEFAAAPVFSLDACGASVKGLLSVLGAAFAAGAAINHKALFADRVTKPFDLDWRPRFLANPCESAPVLTVEEDPTDGAASVAPVVEPGGAAGEGLRPQGTRPEPSPAAPPLDLLRLLVAERAELPLDAVKDEHRLLSDLHLNSITVSQLVEEVARRAGVAQPVAPTEYADATIEEVARALEELARTGHDPHSPEGAQFPPGVDSWLRAFTVEMVETPLLRRRPSGRRGAWRVLAPPEHPLLEPLRTAFDDNAAGRGVVVCLPPSPDESHVGLLLDGVRAVLEDREATHFVLAQYGGGGAGFARSLYLEADGLNVCVVDAPPDHPQAAAWVLNEATTAAGYSEAHYDRAGVRREPFLTPLPHADASTEPPLGANDVLLVTGGGKGIAAECALSLARQTGARLALIGRSRPGDDVELTINLERLRAAGISFRYVSADITDREAVRAAVRTVEEAFGAVTAVLHGAGTNRPRLLPALDALALRDTLRPKVDGLRHLLEAVRPERLRLLVTFGSIIARTGMRGEADYALANEWLARMTAEWQAEHPDCRCLALEWSVWSGVGMGERLGRVEALMREGITPIRPDAGVQMLTHLLSRPLPGACVVVAGRFGMPPTLRLKGAGLPFLRFLEQPRVFYPGIELVADSVLSPDTDPYLDEHVFGGERLLPAVIGLEAMAQAATALLDAAGPPMFEKVEFTRPIVIAPGEPLTLRVAALHTRPGEVEVVLRSERTAFQVDHFRATCRARTPVPVAALLPEPGGEMDATSVSAEGVGVALDPARELYGGLLFQGGRFKRLRAYRRLKATECVAEIGAADEADWFCRYLPPALVLGDPAARDTAIHAVQACIPHETLLPSAVERLTPADGRAAGPTLVHAREVAREGDTYVYDLEVLDAAGAVRESWEGLRLRRVCPAPRHGPWPEPLLGPYVERVVSELIPGSGVSVVVERNGNGHARRRESSDRAIRAALNKGGDVLRRPDGKPTVACGTEVSVSHASCLTLGVAGQGPLGCDIERVEARDEAVWRDLLGVGRFSLAGLIASESGEDFQVAATRVWAATECLKKAGAMLDVPLTLAGPARGAWVLLRAGVLTVATLAESVRGVDGTLVLTVLAHGRKEKAGRDAGL